MQVFCRITESENVLLVILGQLDVCCSDYKEREYELYNNIRERAKNGDIKCPDCNNKMGMHGTYKRKVIFTEFDIQTVKIIQVRCKKCRKVHAVIPNFVFPKKQYDSQTIENAVESKTFEVCMADDSTIRRWRRFTDNNT